ncbi:hypothetical protein [Trebonia kvetii]|uniref:hypothetical protein n=1 Tax=Trebonia kvetii TaxID=2480626 RepID=UPI001651EA1B|nr:hypothetical protein [Trebonia kvetii]
MLLARTWQLEATRPSNSAAVSGCYVPPTMMSRPGHAEAADAAKSAFSRPG